MKLFTIARFSSPARAAFLLSTTVLPILLSAQTPVFTVNGSVQATSDNPRQKNPGNAGAVVWLSPVRERNASPAVFTPSATTKFTLLQKNKSFIPHVLVIPVGSAVAFPNKDPFFHNVFSMFEGKRFDLGLYESGTSRSLRFERPGVSYLFCNIHPEMSAVIIALDTPYYATSDSGGEISIPNVPAGRYMLHVWREGVPPTTLKGLSRPVVISSDSTSLGKLALPNVPSTPLAHKNKYGRDYENPNPPGQIYDDH